MTRQETTFARTTNRNQRLQTKHRKNHMSIWPASRSVKGASKLMSWVSPTSVLIKLFVIMEHLIYFRVCHGTLINKNLKTGITCKKLKYFFWDTLTNKQLLQKSKIKKLMTRFFLHFWNVFATFKLSQKQPVSQMCVVPFSTFVSWSTFGALWIRWLFYIWTTLLITVHTFAAVIILLHIRKYASLLHLAWLNGKKLGFILFYFISTKAEQQL